MKKNYFDFLPLTFAYNCNAKGLAATIAIVAAFAGCAVNRVAVQTTIKDHPIRLEIAWEPEAK